MYINVQILQYYNINELQILIIMFNFTQSMLVPKWNLQDLGISW